MIRIALYTDTKHSLVAMSNVFDEIANIPKQELASDLEDEVVATWTKTTRSTKKQGQGAGNPIIVVEMTLEDGTSVPTSFAIPKAFSKDPDKPRSMLGLLIKQLRGMGLALAEGEGKTYRWERMALTGGVRGNDRHYPVEVV